MATASVKRDRWGTPLPGPWQKLPTGVKGGPPRLYQVADYDVSPVVQATGVAGEEYELVLCKGKIRLVDEKGMSVGFKQHFRAKASDNGLVTFPKPRIQKMMILKKFFEAAEERIAGEPLPTLKRSRTPIGPKQDQFSFWMTVQTVPTDNKPAVEIPVVESWRFELKAALKRVFDEEYLEWRLQDTAAHNTMAKERPLKRQKSDHEATAPAVATQGTIRLPETFGDVLFQLPGGSKIPLEVDSTTEISFAALVEAIVKTLFAVGRMCRGVEPLGVAYEQALMVRLQKNLADPAETKLFFGGQLLTPDNMTPLTSLVEQQRVVVIVTKEAVVKDFNVLRGIPLAEAPVVANLPPLFPDPVANLAAMPVASPSPLATGDIYLRLVKREPIKQEPVKEEPDVQRDIVALEAFMRLLPKERVGALVQCVFQTEDGTDRSYSGIVQSAHSDTLVDVLFEDNELEENLDVKDILIVELPRLQ